MEFLGQNPQPRNGTNGASPFSSQRLDKGQVHELMMVVAWLAAGNIGLWSLAFKQYRCSIYVHFFCMTVLTILVWMSGFLALTEWGINHRIGQFHTWLGISILIIIFLQAVGGVVTWMLQKCAKVQPTLIYVMNWVHRILGFILLILATVQILLVTKRKQKIFIPVLVISIVSWLAYLLQRFLRPKMQGYTPLASGNAGAISNYKEKWAGAVPLVSSSQELSHLNGDYFMFADRVYDLHNVMANHPGGYELIKNIRGRDVDRFIYGSEPLEAVDKMFLHRHTATSMKLAGQPVAEFASTVPFDNMRDVNEVYIQKMRSPAKSPLMYAPYLSSKLTPLIYNGYQHLSQLGKYFAVTIDNSLTRLYSVVNFLQSSNLDLMQKISGKSFQSLASSFPNSTEVPLTQRGFDSHQTEIENTIPLLIKKYAKGSFTRKLLDKNFRGKIKISKPLGRGLSLHEIPAGQIIFLAGGTGINPFCDTIDLLFKQLLVSRGHRLSKQIELANPVLANSSNSLLNKYNFSLYYSADNADELNELTAYQCNVLAQNNVMETHIRSHVNADDLLRSHSHLKVLQGRFEDLVPGFAGRLEQIAQIYVCGPPAMSARVVKAFGDYHIPSFRYKIL